MFHIVLIFTEEIKEVCYANNTAVREILSKLEKMNEQAYHQNNIEYISFEDVQEYLPLMTTAAIQDFDKLITSNKELYDKFVCTLYF